MPLVIVESPNKIPKIKKSLDSTYEVIASVGHIMDLVKKNLGVELPDFTPVYEINQNKKDVVSNIKKAASRHEDIYIATDDDREGEAIAFNILSVLPKTGKNIQRVIFREINKKSILDGINNPVGFKESKFDAQQARRITDRFVGFKVSPVMWSKGLKGTSAGRVQSAALKFVVDREKEIRAFKKEEYWTIIANTQDNFDAEFVALEGVKIVPKNENEVKEILSKIDGPLVVTKYDKNTKERSPPPPFITATLQQSAGTRFKWTAKRTMEAAQSLFSQGLITYHRTDSTRCDPLKIEDIRKKIIEKLGSEYLSAEPNLYGPKEAAQDAHEAIRPTFEAEVDSVSAATDEGMLLTLIKNRFMASQMAPALFDTARIELESGPLSFKANGSVMRFDGYLKIYGTNTNDAVIPALDVGKEVLVKKYTPNQHFTKPTNRYTEPSFINKMQQEGIGRPSTYASLIETLIERGYVTRKNTTISVTEIGILSCDYLEEHFVNLTDTQTTASMELELDQIELGNKSSKDVLTIFNENLERDIFKAKKSESRKSFESEYTCVSCNDGSKMLRKVSNQNVFLGCENWPKCGHTFSIGEGGEIVVKEEETGVGCPDCGNKLNKKNGKFGEFWSCSAYPACNWRGKMDSAGFPAKNGKVQTTDQKCPECKKNMLVKRAGKFGDFLGCQGYPTCTFTAQLDENGNIVVRESKAFGKKKSGAAGKPTGEKCPNCKKNDLIEREGRYGAFIACGGYPKCKYIKK